MQFRRSIFACKDINKNEIFSDENLKIIRPANGIDPKYYHKILGKKSSSNIKFAQPIKWKNIKTDT